MRVNRKTKIVILMLVDILIIASSYCFNLILSNFYYGNKFDVEFIVNVMPITILIYLVTLWIFKMYKSVWSNAGVYEIINCSIACIISGLINILIVAVAKEWQYESVTITSSVMIIVLATAARLSIQATRRISVNYELKEAQGKENVLIIGAGECGKTIIAEIRKEKSAEYNIVGIIDDDKNKMNTYLNGVKVLGNRNKILEIVEEKNIKTILFAIAKISNKSKKEIIDICNLTNANTKIIPGIYELIDGEVSLKKMREVDLKDLLGRDEVILEKEGIREYIENKIILVTGGGGSIGSELCRQIALFNPKELLILDIYENNAYDLQNELSLKFPALNSRVIIASVRDKARLNEIFIKFKPNIVFHAAAHKHVPLMEDNPSEAIKNNVIGTLNLAKCANKNNVSKFVLISTDKAVNPTNVMGATKRICEMIVQAIDKESNTEYVAVRFGNVLGSNGSVVPLFQRQIKEGGPVTLTHKDITRYFMLIPEAAQLVLQAGAYAKGGEVFVLDMGEPVKIYDLAEKLIRLCGFRPNQEIEVKVTGLRPGEKLYEELLINGKGLRETNHKKIFIDRPESFCFKELCKNIEALLFIAKLGDVEILKKKIKEIVPTYISPEEHAKNELASTLDR